METQNAAQPGPSAASSGSGIRLLDLRAANIARQEQWCPEVKPDLSFRGNELGGEVGEACNVIKKLERARHGWRGSKDTVEHLAEELADVVIVTDLIAAQCGIDLGAAVVAKFNATSEKNGLDAKLADPPNSIEKQALQLARLLKHAATYYLRPPSGQTPGEAQSRRRFLTEIDEALQAFPNTDSAT